jgi:glycosyltransferase involved in cell wall biosynthesis
LKIAVASNFWYLRGGLERVMFAEANGLRERGHEVRPFASAHPLNDPAPTSSYFPPSVDHGALGREQGTIDRGLTAARLFHHGRAVHAFNRFIADARPDLVHQHGVSRQLSASVLERAHKLGIPTLLTVHDYSLRCPAGTLSRTGAPVCIQVSCAGHRYDRAVRFSCVHDSRAASAIAAIELLVARAMRRYERSVDLFLVPSAYMRDRMVESGLPLDRTRVLANGIAPLADRVARPGKHVLAYGRLTPVKGFEDVLEAARMLPETKFIIAGDGLDRKRLEIAASDLANLEFTGFVGDDGLARQLAQALVVVVPSVWPEPFGMVVLEAWRSRRPVIVTRRGALPEVVEDGRTGLVVEPDNPAALVSAIRRLVDDPELAGRLAQAGRREVETTYSLSTHLDRLEAIYHDVTA